MPCYTAVLLLFTLALGATSAQDIGCFIPGECVGGNTIGFNADATPDECLAYCKGVNNCNYFTHYSDPGSCIAFSTCPSVETGCLDCISGDGDCQPSGELSCDLVGQCNGQFLGAQNTANKDECDDICQANVNCEWWTFDSFSSFCTIFGDCSDFDTTCSTCITGEPGCNDNGVYRCNEPGTCQGAFVAVDNQPTMDDCIDYCKADSDCDYWTYDSATTFCTLFSSCTNLDTSCSTCSSGEKGCATGGTTSPPSTSKDILFIVGGHNDNRDTVADIDVVDMSGQQRQCDAPNPFPYTIEQAIGFLSSEGFPVVCGGYSSGVSSVYSACYEYSPSQNLWSESQIDLGPAKFAIAGDYLDATHFLVTGGRDLNGNIFDAAVEIDISAESVSAGIPLPEAHESHCMVKISDSEIVMIGGNTENNPTDKSYRYDIQSRRYTEIGDNMNTRRYGHACGFVKSKNIIVVAGNASPENVYTEIFDIATSTWSTGPDFPYAASGMRVAYPQSLNGNFVFIGGVSNLSGAASRQIVEYDPDSRTWIVRPEMLDEKLGLEIVLSVSDNVVNCYN